MRVLLLVFALVLVSGPGAVSGDDGLSDHAHDRSGERTAAQACMPAGHSSSQHAPSCSGLGVAILPGSVSFAAAGSSQNIPLSTEGLYQSLAADRLERPPAASPA